MLTSIKGNGLEGFIIGVNKCLDQYITQDPNGANSLNVGSSSRIDNPAFLAWIKTDQLLLSWMMSCNQESLMSSVIHCVSSQGLWDSWTRMFVSQTQTHNAYYNAITNL